MKLTNLLNIIKVIQVTGEISPERISGIFYDSRKVTKNSVFVAIQGYMTDGHNFIMDAISRGAIAIVMQNESSFPDEAITKQNAAKILVKDSRAALAELSNYYYDEPSRKFKLIGVTGTNGKTTTTFFIKSIFDTAGYKTGLIGTIKNLIGDVEVPSSLTTPESNDLNSLFRNMVDKSCTHGVMEVSSHSLVLKRVHNIHFEAGIFTNLTQEHLDFHRTMDEYLNAKKILFDSLDGNVIALYNADDDYGSKVVSGTKANVSSYGTNTSADYRIKNIQFDLSGTNFQVKVNGEEYNISTSLVGGFNAYNACSAFAVCHRLGIDTKLIIDGIKNTEQVPGRFEVVGNGNKKVVIDYSHTPDSLEKALLAVRNIVKDRSRVIAVFGCGGNRDKTKRPLMGHIASEIADQVIITSDNPRFENPLSIIDEIKTGVHKNNFSIKENREEAIKSAINNSPENSVILIAGKGHENYQEINGVRNHFSDKEIAKKYLSR